jgi:molybdopterin synthase sulfur carrier subunit
MSIQVKFFASLRERLGRSDVIVNANVVSTVMDVWRTVVGDEQMPANLLIAVNMEYVSSDTSVRDGDEVAFFPPVTGG